MSRPYWASSGRRARVRRALARRDGVLCAYCGPGFTLAELTVDHVIPRILGGPSILGNLVLACDPCNQTKDDQVVEPRFANLPVRIRGRAAWWLTA